VTKLSTDEYFSDKVQNIIPHQIGFSDVHWLKHVT